MPKKHILTKEQIAYFKDLTQAKTADDVKMPYIRIIVVQPAEPKEVKNARKLLKQSQAQFADWLGVTAQTVQAWEAGRRKPEAIASKVIRYATKHPEWIKDFAAPSLLSAA